MSVEERLERLERLVNYLLGDAPYPSDLARPGRIKRAAKVINKEETAEYAEKFGTPQL